jgi:2-oxo-3-hexenedioate decarboxylase
LPSAASTCPAGSLVFSGGLTASVPIRPGHAVTAEFENLGTIEVFA